MIITIEKRKVVGYLHTRLGSFPLLSNMEHYEQRTNSHLFYDVVDAEGYKTSIVFSGEFVIVPDQLMPEIDVKIVMSNDTASNLDQAVLFDDGTKEGEAVELKPDDIIFELKKL